jgi:hypothetical protein
MSPGNRQQLNVGPWRDDDLDGTARSVVGTGADADLPQPIRFVAGVAKLIKKRLRMPEAPQDPQRPAVFLLQPTPPSGMSASPRLPMLDNGLTPLTDRLWFVNEMAVTGRFVELSGATDEAVFALVTEQLGLGSVPAVIVDTRTPTPEVRFYETGLSDADSYVAVRLDSHPVTLDQIFDAVSHVHEHCLVTPEAHIYPAKLWKDSSKWWPSKSAEALVQINLRAGLVTAFPTCTVRHEQPSPAGRLDIEIEERDTANPGSVVRYAILELKVLRTFSETGNVYSEEETNDWIESGVTQAASYRTDRNALAAALCCFDMRKIVTGASCFQHVTELATRLAVRLGHWHLFASSDDYRNHKTA